MSYRNREGDEDMLMDLKPDETSDYRKCRAGQVREADFRGLENKEKEFST